MEANRINSSTQKEHADSYQIYTGTIADLSPPFSSAGSENPEAAGAHLPQSMDVAQEYRERGWVPVPVAPRGKNPTRTGWQNSTIETPPDDFTDGCNIGIVLGTPSGGLVDVDLDCQEAIEAVSHLLPPTGLKFGRKSRPNSHWIYVADDCGATERLQFDRGVLVEYRASGGQTVFPPSIHESGEPIEFTAMGEPARISRDVLLSGVRRLAACSLLAKHWEEGMRHDAVLALSGGLLRARFGIEETKTFIRAICAAAHDHQLSVHMKAVDTTAQKIRSGQVATGFPSLSELIGGDVAAQIYEWLAVPTYHASIGRNGPPLEGDIRFTEVGNADRFVEQHGNNAVYSAELKSWLLWKGGRWEEDVTHQVSILGERTVRSILDQAPGIDNRTERDQMLKWGMRSCSEGGINHMLSLAEAKLPVTVKQLDRDPWLLNCTNGVVNLRSGELLPHDRSYWITKRVPIPYEPDAKCFRFKDFLNEITNGDSSLIEFLARALGYSLTGSTEEQCFFIAYGEGANGKSTLLGLFRHIMADYAQTVPVETLIVNKRDGGASPEVVKLRGARYVTAGEAEANQKMAQSLVKRFTGGDSGWTYGSCSPPTCGACDIKKACRRRNLHMQQASIALT